MEVKMQVGAREIEVRLGPEIVAHSEVEIAVNVLGLHPDIDNFTTVLTIFSIYLRTKLKFSNRV